MFLVTTYILIQILTAFFLILPLFLLFGNSTRREKIAIQQTNKDLDFGIIITAYEQTDFINQAVNSVLASTYQNFMIYVVADNCADEELNIDNDQVLLLRPESVLASNIASHFYAINRFRRDHTHLVIIDADNLVAPNFLSEIKTLLASGYDAVQGVRKPKNLNTTLSRLDAARDLYYNFYDGNLLFGCGSSATLAGSGMAFSIELYRECLQDKIIKAAGFDKVLQFEIVKRGHKIAYAPKAIVYDEKTSHANQLINQRSRWINTWFRYFGLGFILVSTGVRKLNFNQFLFGLVLLRPPLFILVILSLFLMLASVWIHLVSTIWIIASFFAFVTGFLIAIVRKETDKRIILALRNIPLFIFLQIISLLNIRSNSRMPVATRHINSVSVNEIK